MNSFIQGVFKQLNDSTKLYIFETYSVWLMVKDGHVTLSSASFLHKYNTCKSVTRSDLTQLNSILHL